MSLEDFKFLRGLIHDRSGILLDDTKGYLFESRLEPLLRREGLDSLQGLVRRLKAAPPNSLEREVVEALTTNETSFFRDFAPFETLRTRLIPELMERREAQRTLTVWSAACASGQEAYSLAMILHGIRVSSPGWTVRIVASDLNEEMLRIARVGLYSQLAVNRGLPAPHLVRHFTREGLSWRIRPDIRAMVEFRRINLKEAWGSLPPMDIILLRNVLFYFDPETRRSILARVRRLLRPDGVLFLGASETTFNTDPEFVPLYLDRTTCYRLPEGKDGDR